MRREVVSMKFERLMENLDEVFSLVAKANYAVDGLGRELEVLVEEGAISPRNADLLLRHMNVAKQALNTCMYRVGQ